MPYLNKAQTWGMNMVLTYRENAQVDYIAQNNNLVNIKVRDLQEFTDFQGRTLQNWYEAELGFTYRPNFFNTHTFGARFRQHQIADTMPALNPYYFINGELEQRYFKLEYQFKRDKRDRANYPLKGHYIVGQLEQYGIGIFNDVNFTTATAYLAKYMDLGKGLYFSTGVFGYLSTIDGQPFSLYQSISGQNYQLIKGYENYRIQGNAFGIHKNELRQRLFDTKLNIGKYIPFVPADQFGTIPLAAYIKIGFDHGYVHNKFPGYFNEGLGYIGNERLTNKYLYGYSLGIDIVSFYDLVIRLEYTITRQGERDLYPHFQNSM